MDHFNAMVLHFVPIPLIFFLCVNLKSPLRVESVAKFNELLVVSIPVLKKCVQEASVARVVGSKLANLTKHFQENFVARLENQHTRIEVVGWEHIWGRCKYWLLVEILVHVFYLSSIIGIDTL